MIQNYSKQLTKLTNDDDMDDRDTKIQQNNYRAYKNKILPLILRPEQISFAAERHKVVDTNSFASTLFYSIMQVRLKTRHVKK